MTLVSMHLENLKMSGFRLLIPKLREIIHYNDMRGIIGEASSSQGAGLTIGEAGMSFSLCCNALTITWGIVAWMFQCMLGGLSSIFLFLNTYRRCRACCVSSNLMVITTVSIGLIEQRGWWVMNNDSQGFNRTPGFDTEQELRAKEHLLN